MGEFTQNLLKLTEFPFSYSLIGLIALIFGQGINLDDPSFTKLGPMLILMGFMATTLSICDPIGALQRRKLRKVQNARRHQGPADRLLSKTIWGRNISPDFSMSPSIFPPFYLFAVAFSPDRIRKFQNINIDWDVVTQKFYEARDFSLKYEGDRKIGGEIDEKKTKLTSPLDSLQNVDILTLKLESFVTALKTEYNKIGERNINDMGNLLANLKDQAIETKWITAEIDRISALIYFLIVISLFIGAILAIPELLPKFAQSFSNVQQTNLGIWKYFQPVNLIISGLSITAFVAVIYMLRVRLKGLETKALTVFKYLTALGAIKFAKEKLESSLNDIERYLSDNHWTLAEYWVNRIQIDYFELFLTEVNDKKKFDEEWI